MKNTKPARPATTKAPLLAGLPQACANEREATLFLERMRWGSRPFCPRCNSYFVDTIKSRTMGEREPAMRWRCQSKLCRKQFSVRTNTPMARTNLPLRVWLQALWLHVSARKGIPALQISRLTGVSYKWSLHLCNRIRVALAEDMAKPATKLKGDVEMDESFIGGGPRSRNRFKPQAAQYSEKVPIVGMVERKGDVRAQVVANVTADTLKDFAYRHGDMRARLHSDQAQTYGLFGHRFAGGHTTVNHSMLEFHRKVRGHSAAGTQTIEGFWSLLKKRIGGIHHAVSPMYLPLYLSEAAWSWNARGLNDGDRLQVAIIGSEGKSLPYATRAASAA